VLRGGRGLRRSLRPAGALLAGLLLLPTGCPAEQLGVELPRGGPQAISHEDLQRDTWLLGRAADPAQQARTLGERLGQMRMLPAFGSDWARPAPAGALVCGRKEGRATQVGLVVAVGDPATPAGAATWAGLVSLAKGWDLPGQPDRTRILCAVSGPQGLAALLGAPPVPAAHIDATWILGPLDGPALQREAAPGPAGQAAVLLSAPGGAPQGLGELDYRSLADRVREILAAIDAG